MKKTLIALAAAATVSLGTLGAASAASTTTSTGALDITAQNGAVQNVGHRFRHRRHFGHRHHFHGYGHHYCKRLYYKGYVLGWAWARFKYVRHCAYRY